MPPFHCRPTFRVAKPRTHCGTARVNTPAGIQFEAHQQALRCSASALRPALLRRAFHQGAMPLNKESNTGIEANLEAIAKAKKRPSALKYLERRHDRNPAASIHDHGTQSVHDSKVAASTDHHGTRSIVRRVQFDSGLSPASQKQDITVIQTAQDMRARIRDARSRNSSIGLVPTMGALHEGHLSLMRAAAEDNDEVWVTIFVNPTQFGPTEDLTTYPRTWEEDMQEIAKLNLELHRNSKRGYVSVVFRPSVRTMYPGVGVNHGEPLPSNLSYVTVDPSFTGVLEGTARPTFFRGVTTVVMKLFQLCQPTRAYFGQKDIQQFLVIRRMVRDFHIPVKIVMVPIERAPSGLALSSRNAYLGRRRTEVAAVLNRALSAALAQLNADKTSRKEVLDAALAVAATELNRQRNKAPHLRARFEIEYISMASEHNLEEIDDARDVKTTILSGVVVMLPLEKHSESSEHLGIGNDQKPIRLLDNMMWTNENWGGHSTSSNAIAANLEQHGQEEEDGHEDLQEGAREDAQEFGHEDAVGKSNEK